MAFKWSSTHTLIHSLHTHTDTCVTHTCSSNAVRHAVMRLLDYVCVCVVTFSDCTCRYSDVCVCVSRELREKIQPEIMELIKQQRLNRLCDGTCFRKISTRRRQGETHTHTHTSYTHTHLIHTNTPHTHTHLIHTPLL